MSEPVPQDVLLDFVYALGTCVREYADYLREEGAPVNDPLLHPAPIEIGGSVFEPLIVLRGSLLLKHWFGDRARVAGDIDLHCFRSSRPVVISDGDDSTFYGDSYESLVDYGKAMCRYSAQSADADYSRWNRDTTFPHLDTVDEATDLWAYGTPGQRYFTQWRRSNGENGRLQIDIAEEGYCTFDRLDISVTEFVVGNEPLPFLTYSPETMLAAKLSWLLRGISVIPNETDDRLWMEWTGEAKDLFDTWLLLTEGHLNAESFQKSLLGFTLDDDIPWISLSALMTCHYEYHDSMEFPGWNAFTEAHPDLVDSPPIEMLRAIAERLRPLLGPFHIPEEEGFLRSISDDVTDEASYQIYADLLEEQGDVRCEYVRTFAQLYFHRDDDEAIRQAHRQQLSNLQELVPAAWLIRLWGSPAQSGEMLRRVMTE
ncbi:MAG: nucleotidyl transferase AbiEii/AbiGii toxin family protein [Planctomycetaceae bacterium]|nr:nucleotidyl transferase AbiEii/AbiGii toxin family protein [Planctomycetaceae bacterium]